jgi:nitrous oxidase accessory protein
MRKAGTMRRRWLPAVALAAFLLLLAKSLVRARGSQNDPSENDTYAPSEPRPAACLRVPAGASLQPLIDSAPPGSALCLEPGSYAGPLTIHRPLTVWGPRSAVILSGGQGTTLLVTGDNVHLFGFTIRGSGNRFDLNDSALKVTAAGDVIEGLRLEGALFGLTAERASNLTFQNNQIAGDPGRPLGLRGDAIRFWETHNSVIRHNQITGSRDIIIWYSSHNLIQQNSVYGGRYGTHFMYCSDLTVVNNRYSHNVVGIFSMYTHGVTVRNNRIQDSSQWDGMGIGVKDSDGLTVTNNLILHDDVGVYLDASPASADTGNHFTGNLVALNQTAILLHATESNTFFDSNSFRRNQLLATVEGRGDALSIQWHGNYFDDYEGYDLNRDGRGDVPFELRSFSTELTNHYPNLAFFRGAPALGLIDVLGKAFPFLQPRLILVDPSPRMQPPPTRERRFES